MDNQSFIPEVKFELAPVELEADLLYSFSRPERRFIAVMNKIYPELEDIIKKSQNKDEAILKCREFAEKVIEKDKEIIIKAKEAIQADWSVISNDFLEILFKHFETGWPKDKNTIIGYVSIMPIFPRFSDKFSFCVGYRRNTAQARETIAHEIVHFLWFKKWKEVFPEIPRNQYESPHLTWRLSEIMDPIILQCQPEIKRLIQPTKWGYDSFKDIKIGDIGMTEYYVQVYAKCVRAGQSFEEILKTLWRDAQEHKDALEKF